MTCSSIFISLTIFSFVVLSCLQMPLKATERDVYEFFTKAGKVGAVYSLIASDV